MRSALGIVMYESLHYNAEVGCVYIYGAYIRAKEEFIFTDGDCYVSRTGFP